MSKQLSTREWQEVDAALSEAFGSLSDVWNRSSRALPDGTRDRFETLMHEVLVISRTIRCNANRSLGRDPMDSRIGRWGEGYHIGQWVRCFGSERVRDGQLCLLAMMRAEGAMVVHPLQGWPSMTYVKYANLSHLKAVPADFGAEGWTPEIIQEAVTWTIGQSARAGLIRSGEKQGAAQ